MDLKSVFFMLCFSLLQSRGDSAESIYINQYNRTGEDVTLFCDRAKHHGPNCSTVNWRLKNNIDPTIFLVLKGQIQNGPRSSRLTLNPDCSLSIKNITEGDYGRYFCGLLNNQNNKYESFTYIYLSVLSVSPTQLSLDETPTGHITLQCTLWRPKRLPFCGQNSLLWLDIKGTVLSGDGVTQENCESTLTVELQSPQTRTFTCQYQENGRVQVSAEYSLRGEEERVQPEKEEPSTEGTTPEPRENGDQPGTTGWMVRHVVLSLLIAALLLCVTVTLIYVKIQGQKAQRDLTRVDTVVYENIEEASVTIRRHTAPPAAPPAQ